MSGTSATNVVAISALTAATSVSRSDVFPASQGADTRKINIGQIFGAMTSTDVSGAIGFSFGDIAPLYVGSGLQISNGTLLTVASTAIQPGGTNSQVQYNNAGAFGGTTAGPFFIGTDAANLTGTVGTARFNGGTNASSSTFLNGVGQWMQPVDSLASISPAVTAAGSDQASAAVLTSVINVITSGGTSTGVVLRAIASDPIGSKRVVKSDVADTQNIYPDGTSTINALGTSAAYALFPGQDITLYRTGTTAWQTFAS